MKKAVLASLTLLCGTAAALILGELAVRLVAPQDLSGSWRTTSARGYSLNAPDRTVRHQFRDRVATYRFNQDHLRGPAVDFTARRILCLGDSYTCGWLVDEEHTFAARLQRKADEAFGPAVFQFLNAGTIGWGAADYVAFTQDFGARLRPSAVLVFVNTDDIGRALKSTLFSLDAASNLVARAAPPRPPSGMSRRAQGPMAQWLLEHSHLVQLVRHGARRWLARGAERQVARRAYRGPREGGVVKPSSSFAPEDTARGVALGRALFRELHAWCRAHGAALWVTTTGWTELTSDGIAGDPTEVFLEGAPAFFAREGIPYADPSPAVMAQVTNNLAPFVIPVDYHPNEKGHALIADAAWPWLEPLLSGLPPGAAR